MKFNINTHCARNLIFCFFFLVLSYFYGFHETLFYAPQSVHVWRQTNSLSLAMNYYQDNLPFLEPEMHNHFPDGGFSGKSVGEFPAIYYLVAQLWRLFGYNIWIFKLVHIVIFYLGLLSLFHSLIKITKSWFWSGFLSLLVFTSPMVIFYGPNFIPDVPALSFVFVAWFFLLKFLDSRKSYHLWFSASFFCLAMLLKITSAISFIAIGGWVFYEIFFIKKDSCIFCFRWKHVIPFLLILVPVAGWYFYVEFYNRVHMGHISYHGIWPVWNITKEQFFRIVDAMDKIYFKEMYLPFTQYITMAIWLFLLIRIKRLKPVFRYFILVLPAGALFQLLLWFQVLEGHDYYVINLLVVFVIVWAIFFQYTRTLKTMHQNILYGIAFLFFAWNAVSARERHQVRYTGWMNEMYHNMKALLEIEPEFQRWEIEPDDKVISMPDWTINGTLTFMNRKGYTEFGSDFSKTETFYWRIEQGAKYFIVNDSAILSRDYLKPFIQNKIGEFKNIHVFDLRNVDPFVK
jgi:hypothetical protein